MKARYFLLLFGCGWTIANAAWAASPSVESVSPAVGQRGTEFQLKLVGAGLADAAEIMLYSPGLKCEALKPALDNELVVRLSAAADCPLGTHAFRIRTTKGISELRTFRVTPFPLVVAEEPNESVAEAKPVPANVTVTGVLESGDVDFFQIPLRRGERLAAEVEAVRLGGAMLDTVLTIYGPDGKPLATADDTPLFRQDPFVTIVAPVDGIYVAQVRETNFEGDENSRYALHVGKFPRPAYVYPAGGPAGERISVRFGGDAAGAWGQDVQLPRALDGNFSIFASKDGLAAPTASPFRVSPFKNVLEAEPNDAPDTSVGAVAALPTAFNGILQRAGDVDCFRFEAQVGQEFAFEAFAARIGSPVDTVLSILDASGHVLVANDDDETHDSRLTFGSPASAQYVLRVEDKRKTGGEGCVYRVEACQQAPRLTAFLPRPNRLSQERQAIAIPRGNRVMAMLAAQSVGVDGDFGLQFEGLPAGVSSSGAHISPGRFGTPVILEAGADAAYGGALVNVRVNGKVGEQAVAGNFVQVVDLVAGSADALFHAVTVDRLAVATVEEAPFNISLGEPKSSLAQDGTIGLEVTVERAANFDGPVDVTIPFLPPWVDGPAKITIAADHSTAVYPLRAFAQADVGAWQICAEGKPGLPSVRAEAGEPMPGAPMYRRSRRSRTVPAVDVAVASQLVPLRIAAAPLTGKFNVVAAEAGKKVTVVCELSCNGEAPEQLTAMLEGLPNRVHVSPVTISRDDRRASFEVSIEPTAPLGSFTGLACRLSGAMGGQDVSYCVGRGGVLKIEAAGTLVTDESGRALSPLEALRRLQGPPSATR